MAQEVGSAAALGSSETFEEFYAREFRARGEPPELSRDQLIEATRAAGCTQQQAADFFATYPAETLVVTLRLRADGTWQESQAIDGGPATKGSEGDWVENGGQLVLSEGGSGAGDIVLDYAIEGGRLSMASRARRVLRTLRLRSSSRPRRSPESPADLGDAGGHPRGDALLAPSTHTPDSPRRALHARMTASGDDL